MEEPLNKPILFVSVYKEVSKTLLPIMDVLKKYYPIYFLAVHHPNKNDFIETNKIFSQSKLKGKIICSPEVSDRLAYKDFPIFKFVYYHFLYPFHALYWKIKAKIMVRTINPQLIFVVSDKRLIEKYLIYEGKRKGIPSICFQWSMGPLSIQSMKENKSRTLLGKKSSNHSATKALSKLIKLPAQLLFHLLRLNTHSYNKFYGSGESTVLAVMGSGPKNHFIKCGIPKEKIRVCGHPLLEEQFHSVPKSSLKTKSNKDQYFLWCNQDVKELYKDYYTYEEMSQHWVKKIKLIRQFLPDIQIILKLHPVYDTINDFNFLKEEFPSITITQHDDLHELIRKSAVMLTRYSTAALYAFMVNTPVITYNYPPLPGGTLYRDIDTGSIHIDNDMELVQLLLKIYKFDPDTIQHFEERRSFFLKEYLNIDTKRHEPGDSKSLEIMSKLVNDLTSKESQ